MESHPIIHQPFFGFFLFILLFCSLSVLNYATKQYRASLALIPSKPLIYPAYRLACLLEDAPASSLKGQAYELAYPLMTPFACIVEQVWHRFYQQYLGKPEIHYWEWKDKPESNNICTELTWLFDLPRPQGYAREVLESLGEKHNPFWNPLLENKINPKGNIGVKFKDFSGNGKFSNRDFRIQTEMRRTFQKWHDAAYAQIGREKLAAIYHVCYGVSWEFIQQILQSPKESIAKVIFEPSVPWWQVLGVTPLTPADKVEEAYKTLIRTWHPDLNSHPNATEITSRINLAYEKYQIFLAATRRLPKKIRSWLSTDRSSGTIKR